MYRITLPIDLNGMRYGVEFFRGVGKTDDKRIVELMRKKGFAVESVADEIELSATKNQTSASDTPKSKTKKETSSTDDY